MLELTAPHHVWSVTAPTAVLALVMTIPYLTGQTNSWLARLSLPFWIFTWFVIVAVILTAIGVFFRGPGWGFILPWRDGLYF